MRSERSTQTQTDLRSFLLHDDRKQTIPRRINVVERQSSLCLCDACLNEGRIQDREAAEPAGDVTHRATNMEPPRL